MSSPEEKLSALENTGLIDMEVFGQVLEMDDEPGLFSGSVVTQFFEQAEDTFIEMNLALENGDLKKISELGHFLKGSSATLGLTKVRDSCGKIQNFGSNLDATGNTAIKDDDVCLKHLATEIVIAKEQCELAENSFKEYFDTE